MVSIEKGVPTPLVNQKSEERQALETMGVGESFSFPKERRSAVCTAAFNVSERERGLKKFTVRGLRVWRVL